MSRSGREALQTREVTLEPGFMPQAEGSCLVSFGETKVICTASIDDKTPHFMDPSDGGWITAEYNMLPRSTHTRTDRRRNRGPKGRTHEIERLIGRSLRQAVDMKKIGAHTITIDCDVMGADGGTRTASITGAWIALAQAIEHLRRRRKIKAEMIPVAAVSVGLVGGQVYVDLNYVEDSQAEVDLNVVMRADGQLIEVQGTGERGGFSREQLDQMLDAATSAIETLYEKQKAALESLR